MSRQIKLALQVAALSDCTTPHGAVIVRGGNVLSLACNRKVTHPVSHQWSKDEKKVTTIHAEQRALIKCQSDCRGATLISARLNGDGTSKPCPMCRALMIDAGIHSVIYYDGKQWIKERV